MKITGVELSSDNANVFSFGMSNVQSNDKYLIKTIIGLDADEVIHKFYGTGQSTKPKFYTFSLPKREIVMRIVLNPNYAINETFSDIRDELYRAIASSRTGLINLLFTGGGGVIASLSGFITKFEVPYFSNVPELQITVKCKDPLLKGFSPIHLELEDISGTNPILISDSLSTAPHGMTASVIFTAEVPTFTIEDDAVSPEWSFSVTPNIPFAIGDVLTMSSNFAENKLFVNRSGVITHLMDRITSGSFWPVIFPGSNEFVFGQIASFDWIFIEYYPAYWGV